MEIDHIQLSQKPKNVTVIAGFPGVGLVATIATGFLKEHLKMDCIGKYYFAEPPATVAIHNGKMVDQISVHYNKKFNIAIIHAITSIKGMEYRAADLILGVCKDLKAKELLSIEGVGTADTPQEGPPRAFHFGDKQASARMHKINVPCLGEGIIVGTTGALMLRASDNGLSLTALFIETHSNMPDSKAAAKAVEVLDKYLGLDVPYEPLLKQAEQFETKIRGMMDQTVKTRVLQEQKDINYVG